MNSTNHLWFKDILVYLNEGLVPQHGGNNSQVLQVARNASAPNLCNWSPIAIAVFPLMPLSV